MMYSWNRKELIFKRKISLILKKYLSADNIETMLSILDIDKSAFDKKRILICDDVSINFDERAKYFMTGLMHIPEDFYNDLTDIFSWFEDISCLNCEIEYPKLDTPDSELITIVHDILSLMDNKTIMKEFKYLIPKYKHLINIQNTNRTMVSSKTECLSGITFYEPIFKQSYVNIFRTNTFEDIETLAHESMHAILYRLINPFNGSIQIMRELEGAYASYFTALYLEEVGLNQEANSLKLSLLNNIITSSYLLMINHILFRTSSYSEFDIEEANKELDSILKYLNISISEEELSTYLSINAFDTSVNMLAYLTTLDLIKDASSLKDATDRMLNLKRNDLNNLEQNLKQEGITFYKDGFKNLIKEYNYLKDLQS